MVGIPIPSVHAFYFEVFDLSDLDHTLRVLGLTLFVAGVVTTILGIALGRFASVRSLRPLADVSRAAGAIAGGDLDTRLDADAADPDLEGFTHSFNAMVDQLQERIEREARFNSDVSHELRSPLTTLAAAMEVLEADRDETAAALPAGPAAAERRPPALSAHGRRPARDVAGRRRLGRRLPRGGTGLRAGAALGRDGLRAHGGPTAGAGRSARRPGRPRRALVAGRRRQAPLRTGHGQPHGERRPLRRRRDRHRRRAVGGAGGRRQRNATATSGDSGRSR